MATENEQVSTNTSKKISDYTDYHKDEQGQTIADVSYFEESAVIPLSGKYAVSDENPKTKSVKLSEVIGGGVTVADNGGIEFSGTDLQLEGISNAESGMVPEKVSNGIHWTTPFSLPTMTGKEGYALSVENDSGTLKPYWEKNVNVVYTDDGIVHDSGSGGVHIAVNLIENGGLEFAENPSAGSKGIKVKNPVPAPAAGHADVNKVLTVKTVNDADKVVWDIAPSTAPAIDGETIVKNGNNELKVNCGYGLVEGSGALCVKVYADGAIESTRAGLDVKLLSKENGGCLTTVPDYGLTIDTSTANDGEVLTYHYDEESGNAESIVWEAPTGKVPSTDGHSQGDVLTIGANGTFGWAAPAGGGGGNPFSNMLSWVSTYNGDTLGEWMEENPTNLLNKDNLIISAKLENGVFKYQYGISADSGSFIGPWAS